MQYEPYIRPVEGAKTAALFIHGIVGTPAHFKDLLPVIPEDWSVYNILLDGHGQGVEEFAHTSMEKWKSQVSTVLTELLATHERVFIVAHSMGTLLAIEEAVRRPSRICGLFLLAVPLVFRVRLTAALGSGQAALGVAAPGSMAEQIVRDSGVRLSPQLRSYLKWLPRFTELTREALRTHVLLPLISVPCYAFQSQKDELVGKTSTEILQKQPGITTRVLENSGHFSYSPADLALLQAALKEMTAAIGEKAKGSL